MNQSTPKQVEYESHLYQIARHIQEETKRPFVRTVDCLDHLKYRIEDYIAELQSDWLSVEPPFQPGDRVETLDGEEKGWVYSLPYEPEDTYMNPQSRIRVVRVFFDHIDYEYPPLRPADEVLCEDLRKISEEADESPKEIKDKVLFGLNAILPGAIAYLGKVEEFHPAELDLGIPWFSMKGYAAIAHPNNLPEPRPHAFAIILPNQEIWEINFGPDLDGNIVSDICMVAIVNLADDQQPTTNN